jgi:glycine dehydrogenase
MTSQEHDIATATTVHADAFAGRHIGPTDAERSKMLAEVGYASLDDLMSAAVPHSIRDRVQLDLPEAASEVEALQELGDIASRNRVGFSMIGQGYHPTATPAVIKRNVLEDPAWYTAYTPYQPEISQGRLEALLNFQTMIGDLTALPTANASLLDEATAVSEAITMMQRASRSKSRRVLVDADTYCHTIAVVRTRADAVGTEVVEFDAGEGLPPGDFFGVVLSYPSSSGVVRDLTAVIDHAHESGALVTVAADLLSLALLKPPGEMGADIAVGSTQRFGVPMFFGGPHAAYISSRKGLERHLPGRLVGVSVDAQGKPAYRLALQTREQHIRRDRATSNICTAQVLLAVAASMYAVYHGPAGLKQIAAKVHQQARLFAGNLAASGISVVHDSFFDTVLVKTPGRSAAIAEDVRKAGLYVWSPDPDHVSVSFSELTTTAHMAAVLTALGCSVSRTVPAAGSAGQGIPTSLVRTSAYLSHPVFNSHHSETQMLRYLRRLSARDFALDRGMIPLGSCTMKLNATTEMEPISWSEFADVHPMTPREDTEGYHALIDSLEGWLAEITGYARVSVQPNAGSQGELAGLLAIRAYHQAQGDHERDVCLIPSSAHGTNAASAVMAGMRVVVVGSRDDGTVDLDDLRAKCTQHRDELAAIMVTYPSTHGVYEHGITELCELVHASGGQVYVDGANLNALLGVALPGRFGGDVSHLNLHKTFCIPHGGGGPGVGPVAVAGHLVPYLPSHPFSPVEGDDPIAGPVSAMPFGSAGILAIPWSYIRMMGGPGLLKATQTAVLSANYVAARLAPHFPVLYTGDHGLVAHECIIDLRPLTTATGVTVDDVAKRLIDYGFHAPTMSFPVAGTFMIEPTESEDLAELDRFCDAMIAIRKEIEAIAEGHWPLERSPLRNAPHTTAALVGEWNHPYDRAQGVFPAGIDPDKYWPPVARIDQAYGDRNLVCACPPPGAFEGE